jgi:dienelactone hydrolase
VAVPGIVREGAEVGDLKELPVFIRIGEDDYLRWDEQLPRIAEALSEAGARVDAKLEPGASHVFTINWDELQPWLDTLR